MNKKRLIFSKSSQKPHAAPRVDVATRFQGRRWLWSGAAFLVVLAAWELLVRWQKYPAYILPAPGVVLQKFILVLTDGSLARHAFVTLTEVLLGLALGVFVALVLGYAIAKSQTLDHILSPYLVVFQAMPIVAVAPLLVIWFGFGTASKVLICALTAFFPMLVNAVTGIRNVDPALLNLMRVLQATRWQRLTLLEIPSASPWLFAGLKVSATFAVIGAVVGEFVGADRGLGFLVNLGRNLLDTPLVFVGLIALAALALVLYGFVVAWERRMLRWRATKYS